MSKREVLTRYSIIIQRLRKSSATFKQIALVLERESEIQGYKLMITKRTFDRDREEIFSLYRIEIAWDSSRRLYKIVESDDVAFNSRMLEAFDTFNALNQTSSVARYIHFERRRPNGTQHIYRILHAIQNTAMIKYVYHKFWSNNFSDRVISPYGLKEFKGRWYVIGKDEQDGVVKAFGLDRISDLETTKKRFTFPKDFDLDAVYQHSFGIISSLDNVLEPVILSFDPKQGKYLKSFPLHSSQKIIIDNEAELRLSIEVYVTYDLVMEILSHGNRVKVLAPDKLILEVQQNAYLPSHTL